jgi:hypothetical protein
MQISTYLRPNIHQNGPEILGISSHPNARKWHRQHFRARLSYSGVPLCANLCLLSQGWIVPKAR